MIIVLPEILDRICYKLRLCSLLLESLPHFRLSTQRKVFHSWHSFYNTLHGLQLRLVSNFCFDNPSTFKKKLSLIHRLISSFIDKIIFIANLLDTYYYPVLFFCCSRVAIEIIFPRISASRLSSDTFFVVFC